MIGGRFLICVGVAVERMSPSSQRALEPHAQHTPSVSTKTDCSCPAQINEITGKSGINVNSHTLSLFTRPSCPESLAPHTYTCPFSFKNRECDVPVDTALNFSLLGTFLHTWSCISPLKCPSPSCPQVFAPRAQTEPL